MGRVGCEGVVLKHRSADSFLFPSASVAGCRKSKVAISSCVASFSEDKQGSESRFEKVTTVTHSGAFDFKK